MGQRVAAKWDRGAAKWDRGAAKWDRGAAKWDRGLRLSGTGVLERGPSGDEHGANDARRDNKWHGAAGASDRAAIQCSSASG